MLFYQPDDGYCYNSDTIFLYAFALRFVLKGALLDVGSGCGILGLLLARDKPVSLNMVEKQSPLARFSQINARVNGIEAELQEGSFLEMGWSNRFDVVVSNPPFYSSRCLQSQEVMLNICRYEHHLPIVEFAQAVYKALKNGGKFVFCYDAKQLPKVMEALALARLVPEVVRFVHPKPHKESTIFLCKAKKGSKSALRILPPLVVFEGDNYSQEARMAFAHAKTHSIKCQVE